MGASRPPCCSSAATLGANLLLIRPHARSARTLTPSLSNKKKGRTTLHAACDGGHTKLARILRSLSLINGLGGARVDAANKNGSTPHMQAASNGQTGTALARIIIGGALIDAQSKQGRLLYAAALRLRLRPPRDAR